MSREVKFRAWVEFPYEDRSPEMIQVDVLAGIGGEGGPERVLGNGEKFKDDMCKITLLQYTGLKDKNGVEIYEGDIIHRDKTGRFWFVEWGSFGDTGFYAYNGLNSCRRIEPGAFHPHAAEDCELIGNIHENPELLE